VSVEETWVRFRALDENGKPATFLTKKLLKKAPEPEPVTAATHRGIATEPALSRGFACGY
jgi:hypothetical protein